MRQTLRNHCNELPCLLKILMALWILPTPNLIGSSSAEKRQVKTTHSGFLMRNAVSEARKTSISFERTFVRVPRDSFRRNATLAVRRAPLSAIGTIHSLPFDHAKLHEILQFLRLDPKNRARLLQFQGALCHILAITI